MISYIKGTLEHIDENFIIIETMGIGYQIYVSAGTLLKLPVLNKEVKIHTFMSVKEDGITLFGFENKDKLDLFHKLISVSGIGPRSALAIIGDIKAGDLIMAIISEDFKTLGKLPGIGKKTAQRLVIELKDKFKNSDFVNVVGEEIAASVGSVQLGDKADAIEALLALGYSRSEAIKAIGEVYQAGMDTQAILKLALKKMVR